MKTLRPLILFSILATIPEAFAQSTLTLEGSNTFGKELGPALTKAFESKNPGITIEIKTSGSGAGLDALIEGRALIAPTSRVANEDELRRARAAGIKLRPHTIGRYGVAVIVHSSNPVRSLHPSEVRDIFTGDIKNWKSVGGPDAPIKVIIRDDSNGSALGFRELAMRLLPYTKSATALPSDKAILTAVATDPHAIGYAGIGLEKTDARPILINGIPANRNAILEGLYPYARTLFLYTNPKTETPEVKSLIRFIQSRNGQRILPSLGFIPLMHISFDHEGLAL